MLVITEITEHDTAVVLTIDIRGNASYGVQYIGGDASISSIGTDCLLCYFNVYGTVGVSFKSYDLVGSLLLAIDFTVVHILSVRMRTSLKRKYFCCGRHYSQLRINTDLNKLLRGDLTVGWQKAL